MRWVVEQHGSTLGSTQVMFLVGTASGSTWVQAVPKARRSASGWFTGRSYASPCGRLPRTAEPGARSSGQHWQAHGDAPEQGTAITRSRACQGVLHWRRTSRPSRAADGCVQRSENMGCTSSRALRKPAQSTLHDGADLAGERSTAGAHDGPRTDERLTPAWVRQREQDRLSRARVRAATSRSIAHVHRRRVWLMRAKWSYVGL